MLDGVRQVRDGGARFVPVRTMHGQVVDELGARIVAGYYPVGGQLPAEDRLAGELGVSKGGLREVLKALAAKGLVRLRPRLGTVVLPRSEWNLFDPQVIDWHYQVPDSDSALTGQLLELRLMVEPEAARLFCQRGCGQCVAELAAASEAMRAAATRREAGREEFLAADVAFHRVLLQASGNEFAAQLARLLEAPLRLAFDITFPLPGAIEQTAPIHAAVAAAVAARDPEAAAGHARAIILGTMDALHAHRRRAGEPAGTALTCAHLRGA